MTEENNQDEDKSWLPLLREIKDDVLPDKTEQKEKSILKQEPKEFQQDLRRKMQNGELTYPQALGEALAYNIRRDMRKPSRASQILPADKLEKYD